MSNVQAATLRNVPGVVSRLQPKILPILALSVLFTAAALYEARQLNSLTSTEVWVHLRTGIWILATHRFPRGGLFSQYPDLKWQDSSWAFDALLGLCYRLFGLRALPILMMLMRVAVAIVTFLLARVGRSGFWKAVLLSAVAQYAMSGLLPLPYVCSIVFFGIELWALLRSRQGEKLSIWGLPCLFLLWANLHAEFLLGLALLIIFLISEVVESRLRAMGVSWASPRIVQCDVRRVGLIVALSIGATLVNPYTYRIFPAAVEVLYSSIAFKYFAELHALGFRRPQDYVLMLLVMVAFLSLGRVRSLELFELAVLLSATGVAFRIERDSWLAVLPAVALVSSGISRLRGNGALGSSGEQFTMWAWAGGISAVAIVLAAASLPNQHDLLGRVGEVMPVKACDYIRDHQLRAPIFNAYTQGSFLTWYLPEYPVVVDSRIEMYGNERMEEYFQAISGNRRIEDAPVLAKAGTFLLERESGLSQALTTFPVLEAQYQQVYSDDVARVFVTIGKTAP